MITVNEGKMYSHVAELVSMGEQEPGVVPKSGLAVREQSTSSDGATVGMGEEVQLSGVVTDHDHSYDAQSGPPVDWPAQWSAERVRCGGGGITCTRTPSGCGRESWREKSGSAFVCLASHRAPSRTGRAGRPVRG